MTVNVQMIKFVVMYNTIYSCPNMILKDNQYKLANIFSRYPEIEAVYLFGSKAIGRESPSSDTDLGIFTKDSVPPSFKLSLLKDLTAAGLDNVDLVMLTTADPVVQYEAVRPNKVVYSTEDFDRGETYSYVVRKYFDLLPYLEVQREAFKKRELHVES